MIIKYYVIQVNKEKHKVKISEGRGGRYVKGIRNLYIINIHMLINISKKGGKGARDTQWLETSKTKMERYK